MSSKLISFSDLKSRCIVVSLSGCWPFKGHKNKGGYGVVRFNGGMKLAHRVSYHLSCGPVPEGMDVLHHCDNPPCCNPAHLWIGTDADNSRDKCWKGRANILRGKQSFSSKHPERLARGIRHGSKTKPESIRRGVLNGCAKITEDAAREIRQRYSAGGVSQQALADEYGINQRSVSNIILKKNWKHVIS